MGVSVEHAGQAYPRDDDDGQGAEPPVDGLLVEPGLLEEAQRPCAALQQQVGAHQDEVDRVRLEAAGDGLARVCGEAVYLSAQHGEAQHQDERYVGQAFEAHASGRGRAG